MLQKFNFIIEGLACDLQRSIAFPYFWSKVLSYKVPASAFVYRVWIHQYRIKVNNNNNNNNSLLKYSTQIAIYKLKVYKKELSNTYL